MMAVRPDAPSEVVSDGSNERAACHRHTDSLEVVRVDGGENTA
jgi:hypothetical protein